MDRAFPSLQEFRRLARKADIVPVCRDLPGDLETPVSCFLKIGLKPYSFLLESVEGGERAARYSFLGAEPSLVFKSRGREIQIEEPGRPVRTYETRTDPLRELELLLAERRAAHVPDLPPFAGGAVGYLGYDNVRFVEKVPDHNPDAYGIPDAVFLFTDTFVVFDHVRHRLRVVCNARVGRGRSASEAYRRALAKIAAIERRLKRPLKAPRPASKRGPLRVGSNVTPRDFGRAVETAKEYIRKGDIIQVVLSQAFHARVGAHPFTIYRALRSLNPSPYMFYLDCGSHRLVGSSPEIHVRCEKGRAVVRPIAGTRPRGRTEREDAALERELLADPKERAEHLMLVDLGRNDLGRVCDYASVKVPEFMTVERYSHVMHLVSHVEGRLRKDRNAMDLLRATFPAGTVSGAPKVRAMQIIDELENRRRGFYAGIVGYFDYSGNLDTCIAIRTILVKDGRAWVQAGAGIVADSRPAREYRETQNKARALLKAIELAERGDLR